MKILFAIVVSLPLSSCVGTDVWIAEHNKPSMIEVLHVVKYNHAFYFGPCGMPWNYERSYEFYVTDKRGRIPSSEFIIDPLIPIIDKTGYIDLNRDKKKVEINVQFKLKKGPDAVESVENCEVNGTYKYRIEKDNAPPYDKSSRSR